MIENIENDILNDETNKLENKPKENFISGFMLNMYWQLYGQYIIIILAIWIAAIVLTCIAYRSPLPLSPAYAAFGEGGTIATLIICILCILSVGGSIIPVILCIIALAIGGKKAQIALAKAGGK